MSSTIEGIKKKKKKKMASVARLVATAGDMDVSGLAAVGYYLRLYAVELILGESQRPKEQTELATELLNQVEEYKGIVDAAKAEDPGPYALLHEQHKAKTYILNFAMSLYNEKLQQLQSGPWDQALRRGLWCCLDLFSCAGTLWGMEETLQNRIKYCKVYLRKIAKEKSPQVASLPAAPSEEPDVLPNVQMDSSKLEDAGKLDFKDFVGDVETTDEEIDNMLKKLKADDDALGEESPGFVEDAPNETAPEFVDEEPDAAAEENSVDFADDEPSIAQTQAPARAAAQSPIPTKPIAAPVPAKTPAAEVDLQSIMDRSTAFEQIQKRARYAISALNYEDVATARQELTSALSLLESLE